MQAAQQSQEVPPGVLFDSSLDGGIDQILALALLFQLQAARRVRVASLSTGRFNIPTAAFLDAVARFYTGQGAGYAPGRGILPVGMATVGQRTDEVPPPLAPPLARIGDDGEPLYRHTIAGLNDTADAPALLRNALSANRDESAVVVLAGFPANLLSLLDLPDGPLWIMGKARVLSIAGGRFEGGEPDPVVAADIPGYRRLLSEWPTRLVMAGEELNAVTLPGGGVSALPTRSAGHPIVDALLAHDPMARDLPTRALSALLFAVAPDEGHLTLSEPGTIAVRDDGRTEFTPTPQGRHHYLIVRPDQRERLAEVYVKLLTEPPPEDR